jgi:thiamine biosynthesis lipoprotein
VHREHVLTEPTWAHRAWRALGAPAEVLIWGVDSDALVPWAIEEIERYEACWSRFRPTSELSRLNESGGAPVAVSPMLWAGLERADEGWRATNGLYDPTILTTLRALGYDRTFREVVTDDDAPPERQPVVGWGAVHLDPERRTASVPPGGAVDLGGLGKGLLADIVADGLMQRGALSVNVTLGGDIKVRGPGPDTDSAWLIAVEHPLTEQIFVRFPLVDEAIVQSTTAMRTWQRGGRRLHHLIDPRTGWPAESGLAGVVVTGPEAWFSEVLAKAALVAGEELGRDLIEAAGHDGWLIRDDGQVIGTANVAADLHPGPIGDDDDR